MILLHLLRIWTVHILWQDVEYRTRIDSLFRHLLLQDIEILVQPLLVPSPVVQLLVISFILDAFIWTTFTSSPRLL